MGSGTEVITAMRAFRCEKCGQSVFFEDLQCLRCAAVLGYEVTARSIVALDRVGGNRLIGLGS